MHLGSLRTPFGCWEPLSLSDAWCLEELALRLSLPTWTPQLRFAGSPSLQAEPGLCSEQAPSAAHSLSFQRFIFPFPFPFLPLLFR